MGGVGKSLLVEEYALRFGAAYPGGVFRLEGTERIDDLVDDLPGGLSEDDRRRWFAPNALGKTVFSTRSREYGSTGGIIDLGVLDARDAYELLTARRKPANSDEQRAAEALVAELGAHALAIDVAGGALSKLQGWSFEGFLAKLRAAECDALDAAAAELRPDLPNGHDRSIARTLALSIDLVGDSGRDVLILASTLAPDVIPIELVDARTERGPTSSAAGGWPIGIGSGGSEQRRRGRWPAARLAGAGPCPMDSKSVYPRPAWGAGW